MLRKLIRKIRNYIVIRRSILSFEQDLKKSIENMKKIKPYVEELLNCKILQVEGINEEVAKVVDRATGIDYLCLYKYGVVGLASRIQEGNNWATFTVRAERYNGTVTEFEKRTKALEDGYMMPLYTMQAYITDKEISIGVCKTEELYKYVKSGRCERRSTSNADFYVVRWGEIQTIQKTIKLR